MRFDFGPSLAALKAELAARVDAEAETARLAVLTPGSGQALEYQATEREARAYVAATAPVEAEYPFLLAERDAVAATTGTAPTLAQVAAEVIAQADAWIALGSEIKRLRRAAKLAIAAASTVDAARAAAQVTWPGVDP